MRSPTQLHPDWLIPDWPAPDRVRALCSTRAGGRSRPPYDSLNLGAHVGDDPQAVQANRQLLQGAMTARPVFLHQVHGSAGLTLAQAMPDGSSADAGVSAEPGLACAVLVADCLPLLLCSSSGAVVGAAHAGWRGLAGDGAAGVIEATLERLVGDGHACRAWSGAQPVAEQILVWLGPCIGAQAFEVGADVVDAFVSQDAGAARLFQRSVGHKWLADLQGLARRRLRAWGVSRIYGNDGGAGWCTFSNPSRFFSHRRDQVRLGGSGRMAACVWID